MPALPISAHIGVVGAGTMGAGIAQVAAASGHAVRLYDTDPTARARGVDRIRQALQRRVTRGRMTAAAATALSARITTCTALTELADCQLIIEAIAESPAAKQQLFTQIETHCAADTLIATNTSSLSVAALGARLRRPHNLVGMHFFNPAPVMRLVEVVSAHGDSAAARCVFATAAAWGKTPVLVRDSPGFVANRVARAFYSEPLALLRDGAEVATLDSLFRAAGFPLGPFELMDVIGNDVNYAVTESVYAGFGNAARFAPSELQRELVTRGWLGRKSGRGWYDYTATPGESVAAVAPGEMPEQISICGKADGAVEIAALAALAERAGIQVVRMPAEQVGIRIGPVFLALTDGRSAATRRREDAHTALVVFDLACDYAAVSRLGVAVASQVDDDQTTMLGSVEAAGRDGGNDTNHPDGGMLPSNPAALQIAAAFFAAIGKQAIALPDTPGLCIMRTICMLANEAALAVGDGICDPAAVDTAMRHGMNHPRGPLAWADQLGAARVRTVIDHLRHHPPTPAANQRYRPAPLLIRHADDGSRFHA